MKIGTMVQIPAGSYLMGSDDFYPDEGPVHEEVVEPFELDAAPVTNQQFGEFVADSGYVTVAERELNAADYPGVDPAGLQPGSLVFTPTAGPADLNDWRQWWSWQPGACWRHPYGQGSTVAGRELHPVVHLSYMDAQAYAAWAGKRLPTEAEWEFAARGAVPSASTFAWGNDARLDGSLMANTWQGRFPYLNTGANGWSGTSPVGTFPPNRLGLVDMIGNVWEWTTTYYAGRHDVPAGGSQPTPSCGCGPDDAGRPEEESHALASAEPGSAIPRRTLKGGSHLCAPEYCLRYRPAARSPQAEDSATTHIGFRCARSL